MTPLRSILDTHSMIAPLTDDGRGALVEALLTLPDDLPAPAPLCERISSIQGVLEGLSRRSDLPVADCAVFLWWSSSEWGLHVCTQISMALDFARFR